MLEATEGYLAFNPDNVFTVSVIHSGCGWRVLIVSPAGEYVHVGQHDTKAEAETQAAGLVQAMAQTTPMVNVSDQPAQGE